MQRSEDLAILDTDMSDPQHRTDRVLTQSEQQALTPQQVLDLLVRAEAAGLLPADGPTSLFVAQKRGAPLQLAVAAADSKIVVRQSRLPFSRPLVFSRAELAHP